MPLPNTDKDTVELRVKGLSCAAHREIIRLQADYSLKKGRRVSMEEAVDMHFRALGVARVGAGSADNQESNKAPQKP